MTFWRNFKDAYNKAVKDPLKSKTQSWRDISSINFLDIFVRKLTNYACGEATFEVISDSNQAEPLVDLVAELEEKRYEITENMLADGDYFVFPAHNAKGEIKHTYLTQDQVRIIEMDGDNIIEISGIIDWYIDKNNKAYYLLRHQRLENDGSLTISYKTVNDRDEAASLDIWDYISGSEYRLLNANHIGVGRYKSPASSRGLSAGYGVPLNFGCAEIEEKIFNDLKLIEYEFKNAKSKIFADPLLMRKKDDEGYDIPENIFPIQTRAGSSSSSIDIFNPSIRSSEHYDKLIADLSVYEKQVGTSKGILTDNEDTATATATAVKRANADTIALINKIRSALDDGNKMTLEADSVYLNIANDLWAYQSDWFDPFEDPTEQWQRLLDAKQNGAAEDADLVKWLYPSLTEEQVDEKLARIAEKSKADIDNALERMIGGA